MTADWKQKAQIKKAAQAEQIPVEWKLTKEIQGDNVMGVASSCGILSDKELEITELDDVDKLILNISSGKWSAYEVTLAYCKRAAVAHQATNCLTEIFFDKALEQAQQLDEHFKKTGNVVGPLHGVPVSLKDQIQIKDIECTMAYASWIGRISKEDAVMAKLLREAGAVFYVKTNIPQTLMRGETDNYVFGLTVNPFNRNLSCGGSSGGEGSLIAFKGSPLGVGSDIGGSIRIPSAFNGLFGLRPTMRRTPYGGSMNFCMGNESIESVLGPMSRSLSGVVTFTKTIFDSKPWNYDPACIEIPWRPSMLKLEHLGGPSKKLSFGILRWDKLVMPHPPIQRALNMVADSLKKAGHEVIEWEPIDPETVVPLLAKLYSSDDGDDFKAATKETGEPLFPGTAVDFNLKSTVHKSWQYNLERDAYRKKCLDAWMATESKTATGRELDGFISPVAPHAAPLHNTFTHVWYTMVYNLLDYPACVFPVTTVDAKLDPVETTYKPISDKDEKNWSQYTPEAYRDAPVNLQVAGRRFREEEVLGLTKVIMDSLN